MAKSPGWKPSSEPRSATDHRSCHPICCNATSFGRTVKPQAPCVERTAFAGSLGREDRGSLHSPLLSWISAPGGGVEWAVTRRSAALAAKAEGGSFSPFHRWPRRAMPLRQAKDVEDSRMAPIKPFHLVVVDDARKLFNVEGPMVDDTPWIDRVIQAQQAGLEIRCMTGGPTRQEAVAAAANSLQYTWTDEDLLSPPPDLSATYTGTLPQYAASGDRKRVIRALCRGRCRATRWAEMTTDYPGAATLKQAQGGDYRAHCLRCGYEAIDPYNWFR
jgi:hypothetical protein